jgi:protein-tyrosine-phosphatase
MFPSLQNYLTYVTAEFDQISEERKLTLQKLTEYVRSKVTANQPARLVFICTHNSRRSHLSQIWAQLAAHYYGIPGVGTYSSGTEATAFNPRAVKAMRKAGFQIEGAGSETNPVYALKWSEEAAPIKAYSKVYDAEGNPTRDFAAVMTCSEADRNCPFIPGAEMRLPLPYHDPKDFDSTPQEEAQYDERTRQIAKEIFYAFSLVNTA